LRRSRLKEKVNERTDGRTNCDGNSAPEPMAQVS